MKHIIRNSLSALLLFVLSACNLFGPAPAVGDTPVVRLTVQTANGATTFSTVGEVINYNYIVTNSGSSQLAGPVTVADLPRTVTCLGLDTIGDNDNFLDPGEMLTCTASYTISQADFNTGSVTNLATANAGGQNSNPSGVTLTLAPAVTNTPQPSAILTLSVTANPQTYSQVAQPITFNYTLTNTGTTPLGPDQFMISDNKIGAPFPCGPAGTTIAPNQPLNCSATYTISAADLSAANVTNSATGTGAGQNTAAATTTITNFTITQTASAALTLTPVFNANLTPGNTIQHQVAVGEWLIQIGRCYGATFDELRNANPQIANPNFILPSMLVTVPRIGSAGRIYGPPCISFHTVQSGDTWASLAQQYNADVAVLQKANPGGLVVGSPAKIPLNSAGATGVTAVPVTPVTATGTVPTTTAAQRITFPAGQTTTSVAGAVNPGQTVQYVLSATQGQQLSISLTGPANTEVTLGVSGPTGLALKTPDGNFTWNTSVTTSGDHYINIASLIGASRAYSLTVSLTSPAAPTFTATGTATLGPTSTPTATSTQTPPPQ